MFIKEEEDKTVFRKCLRDIKNKLTCNFQFLSKTKLIVIYPKQYKNTLSNIIVMLNAFAPVPPKKHGGYF